VLSRLMFSEDECGREEIQGQTSAGYAIDDRWSIRSRIAVLRARDFDRISPVFFI
jgi:hypothetical protein